jgi:hypothetical protein
LIELFLSIFLDSPTMKCLSQQSVGDQIRVTTDR